MTQTDLTADLVLLRTSELPAAELGPEDTVLLDAEHGVYYGLEGPARVIWDMLQTECTLGDIVAALVQRYDVDEATCMKDTSDFVRELVENGLVTTR